jgi:hypothetical protein
LLITLSRLDVHARSLAKDFADNNSIFRTVSNSEVPFDVTKAVKSSGITFGLLHSKITFQCFNVHDCLFAFMSESGRAYFLDKGVTSLGLSSFENTEDLYVGAVLIGNGKHATNVPKCDA